MKAIVLIDDRWGPTNLASVTSLTSSPRTPSNTPLQPQWLPSCSLNRSGMFLPQDICTIYSLYLEFSSPGSWLSLTCPEGLCLTATFPVRSFLTLTCKTAKPLPVATSKLPFLLYFLHCPVSLLKPKGLKQCHVHSRCSMNTLLNKRMPNYFWCEQLRIRILSALQKSSQQSSRALHFSQLPLNDYFISSAYLKTEITL